MRLDHLNGLRAVEAVLRLGSFRAAADEIGVTTAAIGQRVRGLEDALGQTLFHRTATGPVPTDAAHRAAPHLAEGMRALATGYAALDAGPRANRLWLTMTQALAEHWLPPLLPRFLMEAGEAVDLRVDTSPRLVDLSSGEFDFGLRFCPPPGPDLSSVPLMRSLMAPVCTADFARRYGLGPGTSDITGIPALRVNAPNSDPDWIDDWDGWCRQSGRTRRPVGEPEPVFSHYASGLRMAQAGVSMMISGLLTSFDSLRDGRLILPFGAGSVIETRYRTWLVWPRERRLSPVQRRFRDWVTAEAEGFNAEVADWLAAQPA